MKWQPLTAKLPPGLQAFQSGPVHAIVSRDVGAWHISVSCVDRYPTWEEIKEARYDLVPNNCYMAQILPPKEEYVNVHPNTFHLWEIPASAVTDR